MIVRTENEYTYKIAGKVAARMTFENGKWLVKSETIKVHSYRTPDRNAALAHLQKIGARAEELLGLVA